ncbi:MAG TPA: phosphoribosylformylglycinamidine cyclo-ligase [Candidatus Limnocylindria bacterium]|jgi:phosphoribosylformylglycinamidine cyclo-ligase|nr:phosphoribosylformylglycinamidine cyclo-ligase [Candidatus Limnocylindria bacterium]
MSVTYKAAGVDTGRAEDALARVRERIAKTKRPEVIGDLGQFAGLFASPGSDRVLVATTDGVGTKLELARLLDRHEVVGADLVHHCVNDALAMGAEPLFFLDYFATSKIDPSVFSRVVGAMADACARHGVALLGGETAEMPGMYSPDTYDLAGFLVGAVEREKILGPQRVHEGDALVGMPSSGLHTNGYSLAREIIARVAAREGVSPIDVLNAPGGELDGLTLGEALLAPHRPYLREFRALRDVARIHAIAHLTGGGWEGNLPRALPEGTAAWIDRGSWTTPPLFTLLAGLGEVDDLERFATWNMGIGLVAVIAPQALDSALEAVPGSVALGRVVPHSSGRRVIFG